MTGITLRRARQRGALLPRLAAILACGGIGGVGAWSIVASLGLTGTGGAILAAFLGMVIAVALWAVGVAAIRSPGRRR
jgi:hypothetical protein